jgi:leader peptidase (prepilin peptidase) / N-methyltransferase
MAFRGARIGVWTLAATLVTAVTVAAVVVRFGLTPVLPAFCYLAAVGVPLAFVDARERRLPDLATLPSYPASLLLLGVAAPFLAGGTGRFVHALIGMAVAVAFCLLLLLVSPTGIGLGDLLTELSRRSPQAVDVTERGRFPSLRAMNGA